MKAHFIGAVEAVGQPLEYFHVKIDPTVQAFSLHPEGKGTLIMQNTMYLPKQTSEFLTKKLFTRLLNYFEYKFFNYLKLA